MAHGAQPELLGANEYAGIEYAALPVTSAYHEQLRDGERIAYHALYGPDSDAEQVPVQLTITDLGLHQR